MARLTLRQLLTSLAGFSLLCSGAVLSTVICLPAWLQHGMSVGTCPSGEPRQTVGISAYDLGRGHRGSVSVMATAWYSTGPADEARSTQIKVRAAQLTLVDRDGKETPLKAEDGWDREGRALRGRFTLPAVPDGDYTLRAWARTGIGEATADVKLPIYAPARINVLTDRPLYEPGNTVLFRALALRARDLTPLDGRPGTWTITDPNGEVLLEERAPAGDWGVVAGSFPLDSGATPGIWTVTWQSNDVTGRTSFKVEPFTLPRFRVEAEADAPAYHVGDRPVISGSVLYSSGAPVAGARLKLRWSTTGDWPPPAEWMDAASPSALPTQALTDARGRFKLSLPAVPADLLGVATLSARVEATDPAGDLVTGAVSALLSRDRLLVSSVTELSSGLVEGFNNRVYLRATTPWGQPMRGVDLAVTRAWDPTDKGVVARTDEDGVAALQLDPGPPVTVLVPAQPLRLPPAPPAVKRSGVEDVLFGALVPLDDLLALDRWEPRLAPCARFADPQASLALYARVGANGAIQRIYAPGALGACAASALRDARLAAGDDRLYRVNFNFNAQDLPNLTTSVYSVTSTPPGLEEALQDAALDARLCLPSDVSGGAFPALIDWRVRAGQRGVELGWLEAEEDSALSAATVACVQRAFQGLQLRDVAEGPLAELPMGTARLRVIAAPRRAAQKAQDTTLTGYELKVSALQPGAGALAAQPLGDTRVRFNPGLVPPLRMRATPVLARPGDSVQIDLLRGPDYEGGLPDKLWMNHAIHKAIEAKFDKTARKATFVLPADAEGWWTVRYESAEARVFVAPAAALSVSLTPDQPVYAPGDEATLRVQTRAGDQPVAAAVGLFGVDSSLGQLAPLLGPDALDGLQPQIGTSEPAFGTLDGQALAMGRIAGANAAAATVLRVSAIPTPPELDAWVNVWSDQSFSPLESLTDSFYVVLSELHAQARSWEQSAPAEEQMKPATMARLWTAAVEAAAKRGEPVSDAYGRRLRLRDLPPDLLELTDPQNVVANGARRPEDVENWAAWVARERP